MKTKINPLVAGGALIGAYLFFRKGSLTGVGQTKSPSFGEFEVLRAFTPKFKFKLDELDFYGRDYNLKGIAKLKLSYQPASRATTDKANANVIKLQAIARAVPAVAEILETWTREGEALTQKIFDVGEGTEFEAVALGARGEVDIFGKVIRNQTESNRIQAFNQLKSWITKIANFNVAPYQEQADMAKASEAAAAAQFEQALTQGSPVGSTQNALAVANKSDNTFLYVGGGVALLSLLGLGIYLSKRK